MQHILKRYGILLLVLVSIFVYLNTLTHGFVYDDTYFSNRRDLYTWSSIPRVFTESYLPNNRTAGVYRPLTIASYALTFTLFGSSPVPFHLINLLLHALTTYLVFVVGKKLKLSYIVAFIAALFFAVHPIHVEAVANIKARDEIFYGLFLLLSLWSFIKASESKKWFIFHALLSITWYFLAILSKEMAVTIPLVCLLYLVLKHISWKRLVFFAIGWGSVTIVYAVLRNIALNQYFFGAYNSAFVGNMLYIASFPTRFFTGLHIYFIYLKTFFFPMHLSATYGYASILPITNPIQSFLWVPGALLLALTCVLLGRVIVRGNKLLIFTFGSFLVLYIPVSQIIVAMGDIVAERWMYAPSIMFFYCLAFILTHWIKQTKLLFVSVAIIVVLLGVRTLVRNPVWATNLSIYESMVASAPRSVQAQTAVAQEYFYQGRLSDAKKHAALAQSIYPEWESVLNVLGKIAIREKRYNESLAYFNRSLKANPKNLVTHSSIGRVYFVMGKYEEALPYFERIVQRMSLLGYDDIMALASTYTKLKRYKESLALLQKLTKEEQTKTEVRFLLAVNFYKLGEKEKVLDYILWNTTLSREEREHILEEY